MSLVQLAFHSVALAFARAAGKLPQGVLPAFRLKGGRAAWCLVVALALPLVAGCGGCRPRPVDPEEAAKAKEAEEKAKQEAEQPDFEKLQLELQPGRRGENARVNTGVKPGHWMTATATTKANKYDFPASLQAKVIAGRSPGDPTWELEHTPYRLHIERSASLPKGQIKEFELPLFVPRATGPLNIGKPSLDIRLASRRGGREVDLDITPLDVFAPHQYFFVVLARDEKAYDVGLFTDSRKRLFSFRTSERSREGFAVHYGEAYRVLVPRLDRTAPLPSQSLAWTSIAYVLWDDIDPNLLTPEQQTALVDWLHWGGQLIISGPASLDSLKTSFLADFLPAQAGKSGTFPPEALAEWNATFASPMPVRLREPLRISAAKPPAVIELVPQPGAEVLSGTGGLVLERAVGRGRVVVTAFSLANSELRSWRHFDNFFHACLLRRPAREFAADVGEAETAIRFREFGGLENDSRLFTRLRYFTRDAGSDIEGAAPSAAQLATGSPPGSVPPPERSPRGEARGDSWQVRGFLADAASGSAGWTDSSGPANAARLTLQTSAGVTVPQASFVLEMVGLYLLALVPLNWCLFKLLGRVEWAWVAAPFIAIMGAVFVVRMAQLDIGFVRSRTEVGVLEVQGGYPRAHLTRYAALYNSLSTTYEVSFTDPNSLALPFAADLDYRRLAHQAVYDVHFIRDQGARFGGFFVPSNATGMLHAEQTFALGGTLALNGTEKTGWRLANETELNLRGAAVLRCRAGSAICEAAWVGDLGTKNSVRLTFLPAPADFNLPQWGELPEFRALESSSEVSHLSLEPLLRVARLQVPLAPGEVRLLAFIETELPGLSIAPNPSQAQQRTLVVAHLALPPLPQPQSDANCPDPRALMFDDDKEPLGP